MSPVRIRYWEAGGWHLHVTFPEGDWLRRVYRRDEWYQIDAEISYYRAVYGAENVWVDG